MILISNYSIDNAFDFGLKSLYFYIIFILNTFKNNFIGHWVLCSWHLDACWKVEKVTLFVVAVTWAMTSCFMLSSWCWDCRLHQQPFRPLLMRYCWSVLVPLSRYKVVCLEPVSKQNFRKKLFRVNSSLSKVNTFQSLFAI